MSTNLGQAALQRLAAQAPLDEAEAGRLISVAASLPDADLLAGWPAVAVSLANAVPNVSASWYVVA